MITSEAAPVGRRPSDAEAASRIVRIAEATWPLLVSGVLLVTVALAVPHDAWLPRARGPATADDWSRALTTSSDWLAWTQTSLGRLVSPDDPVAAAVGVAAASAATAVWLLATSLRHAGLTPSLAALLALVAMSAPFGAWQAASPLGAAPLTAASAFVLWRVVRRGARGASAPASWYWHGAALLAGAGLATAWLAPAVRSSWAETLGLLSSDLGFTGGLLVLASLARQPFGSTPSRIAIVIAALLLLSSPLSAHARLAAMLPWAWWLVAVGLAQLLSWRAPQATRWAVVGVSCWLALHAGRIPWGLQHQQAALTRTWADVIAQRLDQSHVLVEEVSARGALLTMLASAVRSTAGGAAIVLPDDAYAAVRAGRTAVVTSRATMDALRWGGVAFDAWPDDRGQPLERLLDALPKDTVVLTSIAADVAARLTPLQWQALGRVGLRLADAGTMRAHAVVGVTGARVEALEAAQAGSVRLDVQPGDPLGRTGVRSPVDARLDADGTSARITLRGQPLDADGAGILLLLVNTRGDILAWRAGSAADRMDGPSLGVAPPTRGLSMEALPCVDVAPGVDADLSPVLGLGAVGFTFAKAGALDVRLTRPVGAPGERARLAVDAVAPTVTLTTRGTVPEAFTLHTATPAVTGVNLRGAVTAGRASAHVPVRACAAWPVPYALDATERPLAFGVSPAEDAFFQAGWHDSEVQATRGYFRWMAGRRAELVVAVRRSAGLTFSLDAQAPVAPTSTDAVRLSINGHDLGTRPLLPTRGIYEWDIDATVVRRGVNRFVISTTQSIRPADRHPGGDPRVLGLVVRGWTLGPSKVSR